MSQLSQVARHQAKARARALRLKQTKLTYAQTLEGELISMAEKFTQLCSQLPVPTRPLLRTPCLPTFQDGEAWYQQVVAHYAPPAHETLRAGLRELAKLGRAYARTQALYTSARHAACQVYRLKYAAEASSRF